VYVRISKTFIKSSLIYTIAGTLPLGSAVILLPFYIAYLSTADFGALSVYFAFALFIQICTTYSFDTSLYIHFHEFKNDKPKLASFVSTAFVLMLAIGLGIGIIFIFSGEFIFSSIFSEKPVAFYPYGFLTAATGIFQALFKVHGNLLQSREKPEIFLRSNLFSFALIVIFTMVGLTLFPGTLIGPVGGRLLAAFISGLWALNRIFREFGVHFDFWLLRSSFSFNFYTFIYQLLQWVINYIDRIIMVFYLALAEVGIYDFAMKCLLIIEFILNGLHNTFYPKVVSAVMAQPSKGSTPEINRYYHGFISVIMILICLSILAFPWLIETFVKKEDYRSSIQYFPYIALIYIFRALRLFFAAPYGILKFTRPLPVIYLIVSAIKIFFTVILITGYGIYGVITSSLLSAVVEIILLRFNIKAKFQFRYNLFKVVIAPMVLFGLILFLEPLLGNEYAFPLHTFYTIGCGGLLWWTYRNEIKLINPMKASR
jgi:O-antigen/teichoic acid export membrane protein